MLEIDRYLNRSTAFDKIISATHDHFWDPLDKKYIDFADAVRHGERADFMPDDLIPALQTDYVVEHADEPAERIRFANQIGRWVAVLDPARRAGRADPLGFALPHAARSGRAGIRRQPDARRRPVTSRPSPSTSRRAGARRCRSARRSAALLHEIVHAPEVYKKIVGMQMLVEGLAMGAFATFYQRMAHDPLLVKLMQLVMTDEAFHHKFGKIWADRTIPKLSQEEHEIVEDWAAHCFQTLLFNLVSPAPDEGDLRASSASIRTGCMAGFQEAVTDDSAPRAHEGRHQHLPRAGQDAAEGRHHHRPHARRSTRSTSTSTSCKAEGDEMVGDAIADEGIQYLQTINFGINTGALSDVKAAAIAAE